MDTENETAKFKFMLFAVVAFLVSGFFAYMDLKYATSGKTAQGTVDRIGEVRGPPHSGHDEAGGRPALAA